MNNKKTAIISGVTGQDGSYLAELLLEKDYNVIGIKRRISHLGSHERLDSIYNNPNFKLIYGNMHDASSIFSIINTYKPDEFYNLAAQSHVRVSFEVTEETLDTVAKSTLRILNAIRELSPKTKFYQASSSEMYGTAKCPETGYTESCIMQPASPYASAKLFAHNIVKNYRNSYNMFASSGILFNHESARRGETFVSKKISMAAARIKTGVQDKLYLGNLDAKRDWGHAKDYVEGMYLMLQHDKPDDFVLATGETHTVREYLEETFKLAGLDINEHVIIDQRLFRPEEVPYLLGDYTKAKNTLGWKPKIKFKDLVQIMYEYEIENIVK